MKTQTRETVHTIPSLEMEIDVRKAASQAVTRMQGSTPKTDLGIVTKTGSEIEIGIGTGKGNGTVTKKETKTTTRTEIVTIAIEIGPIENALVMIGFLKQQQITTCIRTRKKMQTRIVHANTEKAITAIPMSRLPPAWLPMVLLQVEQQAALIARTKFRQRPKELLCQKRIPTP